VKIKLDHCCIHHVRWVLEKAQTRMAVKVLRQDAAGGKMSSSSFMSEEQTESYFEY
jgi:hypothetical protein